MTDKKQNKFWSKVKKYLNHVFIDGLSGMALGLFATLIIGTIIAQIGSLIGGTAGKYINMVASVAKAL
ncbi:MAG TPA: PTS sugar transporter subunit IIC, partial [Clostridia bacterium]|nr:PTS sugar transporter subunit IIC [Clostridia bacterium]